jgi:hypothetical protein
MHIEGRDGWRGRNVGVESFKFVFGTYKAFAKHVDITDFSNNKFY